MMVIHVFRYSEGDAGGGGQEWQFQRDFVIEQPHIHMPIYTRTRILAK